MTLKHLPLPLVFISGCAHSMPGLVDMEFWYKTAALLVSKGLPTIVPNSPGSTTMAEAEAPSGL